MTEPRKKPAKSKRPRRAAADQSVAPSAKPVPANPWPGRLKELRDRLGLNQSQAAAKIRISQSQWSSFESGARVPTRPIAHLIELLEAGKV